MNQIPNTLTSYSGNEYEYEYFKCSRARACQDWLQMTKV